MSMNNRKIAGFMSAESIYSLAFYIVMVAAIAGVGAGIMSKSAAAKGVSAVSILRANYQAQVAISGYGAAAPTVAEISKLSSGLIDAAGSVTGVGAFTITNRTTASPVGFSIDLTGVANADVCKAVASTGFGSWDGLAKGALASSDPIPSSAATSASSGLISTKGTLLTVCNAATASAPVTLTFVSQ